MLDTIANASVEADQHTLLAQDLRQGGCGVSENRREISKMGSWGGPRANSGGPRPGAGRPRKRPAELIAPGPRWYCIQAYARHEDDAQAGIEALGFDTFVPRERVDIARIKQGKRVFEIVERSLFGAYFFARFDLGTTWRDIAHVQSVRRIFGITPDRPTAIPEGWVESIIVRSGETGVIDDRPDALKLAAIAVGGKVRLLEGPFADLTGICQWSDTKRITILMDAINGKVPVTMARASVQEVAPPVSP